VCDFYICALDTSLNPSINEGPVLSLICRVCVYFFQPQNQLNNLHFGTLHTSQIV